MPTVRLRQDQATVQALQGSRVSVQADPSAFGADAGRVLSNIGGRLEDVAEKAKRDATNAAITAAQTEMMRRESALRQEVKQKRGKDAIEFSEQALSNWDAARSEIAEGLSSEEQRQAFGLWADRGRIDFDFKVNEHASREADDYDAQQTESFVNLHLQRVGDDPADEVSFLMDAEAAVDKLMARADRQGLPPETKEVLRKQTLSQFAMTKITAHAVGEQTEQVKKSARNYSEWLSTEDRNKVTQLIDEMERTEKVQSSYDEIITNNNELETVDDYDAALREAETSLTGDERDEVVTRINARWRRERHIEQERENKAFSDAREIIVNGGSLDDIQKNRLEMSDGQWSALRNIYEMESSGAVPVTSPAVYQNLATLAADPSQRDNWVGFDLLSFADRLAPKDLRHFQDLQVKARTSPEAMDGLLTDNQAFTAEALAAGFDTSPDPGDQSATRLAKLKMAVDREVRAQREAGQVVGAAEVGEITRRMAAESVYNSGMFVGALTETDIDLGDVPGPKLNSVYAVLEMADMTPEQRDAEARQAFIIAERNDITPEEAAEQLVFDDLERIAMSMPDEDRAGAIEALRVRGMPVNSRSLVAMMVEGRKSRQAAIAAAEQADIESRATVEAARTAEAQQRALDAAGEQVLSRRAVVRNQVRLLEGSLERATDPAERRRIQSALESLKREGR